MIEFRQFRNIYYTAAIFLCSLILITFSGCSLISSKDDTTKNSSIIVSESDLTVGSSQTAGSEPIDDQEGQDGSEDSGDESDGILWYPDNTWVFVDNSWLNIRNGPSTDNAIITEVYHAQPLKRVAVSDYWSEIILPDGRKGYAYNSYLSLIPVEGIEVEQ